MMNSRLAIAVVLGILSTLPASAQEIPTFELSAGYQFTRVPDQITGDLDENLPLGFAVDAGRNWGMFGLIAEGGWARHSDESFGTESTLNLWHVGAGPRWSGRRSPRVTPYVQLIGGIAHARSSVSIAGVELDGSDTNFMLQPGGGVSVEAGDGWAVFGAADYRRVFFNDDALDESGENEYRFMVGLRMLLD